MSIKMSMKSNLKKAATRIVSIICVAGMLSVNALPVQAAPARNLPYASMPKYHSSAGSLQYIQIHGMESYTTKDTFNLEQFLIDNPDLVAASITDRDAVWEWIKAWDGISPRILHSTDPEEEYYCRARNLCIELGVYGPTSTLSVKEKCKLIHDEVCRRGSYDYSRRKFTFKSIMDSSEGICNAYTTYGNLMFTIAGIENGFVEGPGHNWNAVLAEDGNWYQIDLTWDCCDGFTDEFFWVTDRGDMDIYGMYPTAQDPYITQDLK